MNLADSSNELKATVEQYIENFWKADIYRDLEDYIKYADGEKHQNPRSQAEIKEINDQLDHYASILAEYIIEQLKAEGIFNLADLRRDSQTWIRLIQICEKAFPEYGNRFKFYVKGQFSNQK